MKTIDFGIDLGTTNSLIARFGAGQVQVFKNPVGFKETLPSCVAFRGERILIGEKAREYITKDPLNVFSSIKRKMGTGETYFVPATMETISPVELSAHILRELKNFIGDDEKPKSVIITIPASFDTVQSNATKQAGYSAGFEEVVLLQEPIAASLAFFNDAVNTNLSKGKWMVFDLGGGTFDAAIIALDEAEMRVLDHLGDNFLGGVDFDYAVVLELLVPKIIAITGDENLQTEITKPEDRFEKLFHVLMLKAEEAKKELSRAQFAEIELIYTKADGSEMDVFFEITRLEFENIIKEKIEHAVQIMDVILERNKLAYADLEEIILIGGSTLIPLVRQTIKEKSGIKINHSADPTNAVAVGAAFYAGTKLAKIDSQKTPLEAANGIDANNALDVKIIYNPVTKDKEEYITAKIDQLDFKGFYRITRADGGLDTGFKPLLAQFGEFVALRENTINEFNLKIFDENYTEIYKNSDPIIITQGLRNLHGQPLPEAISIEVDDLVNNTTKCELIFARNSILPLRKTIYKEISRTIHKNQNDVLIIHVLEGDHENHPSANKVVGLIEIAATHLKSDLIRGSEVEIIVEMTESRDISVKVNLLYTNQEFAEVFNPTARMVSVQKLKEEILFLQQDYLNVIQKLVLKEDFERAAVLQSSVDKMNELQKQCSELNENDKSDLKYQLEERKRKIAGEFYHNQTSNNKVLEIIEDYYDNKRFFDHIQQDVADFPEHCIAEFNKITTHEVEVIKSRNYYGIKGLNHKLIALINRCIYEIPILCASYFHLYSGFPLTDYSNEKVAENAMKNGEKAFERQNYTELAAALKVLVGNYKHGMPEIQIKGTGLG